MLTDIVGLVGSVINKIWPDATQRDEAKQRLAELAASGELEQIRLNYDLAAQQIKTNQIEAASPSLFVSGWRPFIGWIAGFGLACYYIPQYLIGTYFWIVDMTNVGHVLAFPLNTGGLMELTAALLGIGTLRTIEKVKKVARNV